MPSGVRNLSALVMDATTVMIQWLPPLVLNGILVHYRVNVNEIDYSIYNTSHIVENLSKYYCMCLTDFYKQYLAN